MERAGNVSGGEVGGGTRVEENRAFGLESFDLGGGQWLRRGEFVDGGCAVAVELDVATEVFGARRKAVGEEMNEFVFAAGE